MPKFWPHVMLLVSLIEAMNAGVDYEQGKPAFAALFFLLGIVLSAVALRAATRRTNVDA